MKFVALVSGGKDSMFNILHCLANGHTLEALANLHPPITSSDEMDSFMYQTVGYHAVSLYDQCLGVPMYRAEILGSSVVKSLEYSPTSTDDETEDLYRLLRRVVKSHDIEAVSVGAILSTYQRTRVESVCQRLGLTCLSYLWNRSQAELLDEIIASGVDARIIKTAGIGLNSKHLGRSLGDIRDELVALNAKFGLHLCGEGGEYETLVLDAPNMNKRLVLDVANCRVTEDQDCVSYLSDLDVRVDEKDAHHAEPGGAAPAADAARAAPIRIPPVLEDEELYGELKDLWRRHKSGDQQSVGDQPGNASSTKNGAESAHAQMHVSRNEDRVFITNVTAGKPNLPLDQETHQVFAQLKQALESENLTLDNLVSISLLVADMSTFQQVNSIYNEYFPRPNPPSRQCIQTSRLVGKASNIQLSALATRDLSSRSGLHVQGRSYWAPANIGPYAQAIQSQEFTTLAGQIGLVPATLQLEEDPVRQIALSLQHISRVSEAVSSETMAYTVAFTTTSAIVPLVCHAWKSHSSGPLLVAVVGALPRNASVEWTGQAINERFIANVPGAEDDEDDKWVYPAKLKRDGYEYGRYGTRTLYGEDAVRAIKASDDVFVTVYTTKHELDYAFNCEVVYVDSLYDKTGGPVTMGAVMTYKL